MKKPIIFVGVLLVVFVCTGPGLASTPKAFVQLGHSGCVYSVAFSPDGRLALSGSADNTVKVWKVATGRELVQLARFDDGGGALITPEGYFKSNGVFILDSFLFFHSPGLKHSPFRRIALECLAF